MRFKQLAGNHGIDNALITQKLKKTKTKILSTFFKD